MRNFLRSVGIVLSGLLFGVGLSFCAGLISIESTIARPDVVKGWLSNSGIYNEVIPSIASLINNQDNGVDIQSSPISADIIIDSFKVALPPDFLQAQTEKFLDSVYVWLNGQSTEIKFSIPLEERKAAFEQSLAVRLQNKLSALPACPAGMVPTMGNPLSCKHRNLDLRILSQDLASQMPIFNAPLTEKVLGLDVLGSAARDNQQSYLTSIPFYWQKISLALTITIIFCTLMLIFIYLLASDKLRTFKKFSRSSLVSSLLSCVTIAVVLHYTSTLSKNNLPTGVTAPDFVIKLAKLVAYDTSISMLYFYTFTGILSLIAWVLLRKHIIERLKDTKEDTEKSTESILEEPLDKAGSNTEK
jgi:chromate transport protein ChrA